MEDGFLPTNQSNQISTAAHHCSQGCPTKLWLQCSGDFRCRCLKQGVLRKKSCLFCHLICAKNAELVRIEVLSRDSMSCLFILCLQLVSLCTGCAHGNYVDACATESYQMKILENGTSHNLVWGKPVTLFHTATDSRRHRHSRHSHHAEFLKPDAMGVMMRSRGRYFKGRFLRDGFQYLCRPNCRARKSRTAWLSARSSEAHEGR